MKVIEKALDIPEAPPEPERLLSLKKVSAYPITYKHHLIFWAIYFVFNTIRWGSYFADYSYSLKTNLIGFPIHIALSYFTIYFLMPRFVYRKKYLAFAVLLLAALYIMLWAKFLLTYYLVSTNVWPEGPEAIDGPILNYAIQTMMGELYVISFVTAIKITVDWLREHNKIHELEKRQMATELRFLRSQISPHFFFNTLNNIYFLTQSNPPKAGDVILKLSELMRYLLYATKKRKQSLRNEINCLQNYIELERIRFDERLEVNIGISGSLEKATIAPMLLVPLLENCFKHGASKHIGKIRIDMDIEVAEDTMYFKLTNTVPPESKKDQVPTRSGGIGLSNVRKRLELGYDPDDYEFRISRTDDKFAVYLRLAI